MKIKDVSKKATKALARTKMKIKVKSPEILLVTGIVGGIGAGIMACRATWKAKDVCEEAKEMIDAIDAQVEEYPNLASEKEIKVAKRKIVVGTSIELGKLFGPSLLLGTGAVVCVCKSHNIMADRNAAIAAAYALADKGFKEYRARVVDRFGEEVDNQLKNDVKTEKIEKEETNEEGKTKKVKKKTDITNLDTQDIYVRIFDRRNSNWSDGQIYVEQFFSMMQSILNDQLIVHGYLTLNDALTQLGMEKVMPAGQVVGWRHDPTKANGDGYVQLKVRPIYYYGDDMKIVDAYSVEFNCDGYILDTF